MGRTDLVTLIEKAKEARRELAAAASASEHKDATEATDSSSALDGAGALDPDVDGAAAKIEEPEGSCWYCKTPANAQGDNLSACRGCKKVTTLGSLIAMHLKYIIRKVTFSYL